MKTFIIGHQKPDSDATVAALGLQKLYESVEAFGYKNTSPEAVITDPLNPETSFIFNKLKLKPPRQIKASDINKEDKIVLVDHNEESQRLEDINPDQIVEIIDHHKANLNLNNPIFMTFKTWGSTTTIIYFLMKQNNVKPDKTLASLMLAAILSDTVGYKSATTTDQDKKFGGELAKLAGITDADAFTLEIFEAKSNVSRLTDDQIVKNDYKFFDFNRKTFINQIETVEQEQILKRKPGLLKAMQKVKTSGKVSLVFCAVTDILQINTKLLCLGDLEAQVAQKAFGGKVTDNIIDIGPKLSRKKEIAPPIEKALGR